MLTSVVKIILPILLTFMCGIICKKIQLFDKTGCQTLKDIVSKIMLPVVLVDAFMFADYSLRTLSIIITLFVATTAVFFLGYLVKGFIPDRAKYMPFLFSTLECGTLGYPLIAMLFGQEGTSNMALIDVGHTVFLFMIAVPLLQATDGNTPNAKDILKRAIFSPTFDAMLIGIVLGIAGVDEWLAASSTYEIYTSVVDFITAPTGVLILLTLGFDITFEKKLMKPVLFTSLSRIVTMAVFCAGSIFVISKFYKMDTAMLYSLILAFSLPASYGIPMFAKFEGHKEYVSVTISFSTLLTLSIFVIISVMVM